MTTSYLNFEIIFLILEEVWLSESRGRSRPSVITAKKTSSVKPLSKAPSGIVKLTPKSGKVSVVPEDVTGKKE